MIDNELTKALLPKNVIEKLYDDLLSPAAKELGGIGSNAVKTFHLVLLPLQIAAAFQDRLTNMCARIAENIPELRKIAPPAEIVGPAIERMKFLEEENPLWQMFEELISHSCDKDEIWKVHPAFLSIIAQLSPDEGRILYLLSQGNFEVTYLLDFNPTENRFETRRVEHSNLPRTGLLLPDRIDLYYSHLHSLSLVEWPSYKQDPIKDHNGQQTGLRQFTRMHLSDFGKLFVDACLPKAGFNRDNN